MNDSEHLGALARIMDDWLTLTRENGGMQLYALHGRSRLGRRAAAIREGLNDHFKPVFDLGERLGVDTTPLLEWSAAQDHSSMPVRRFQRLSIAAQRCLRRAMSRYKAELNDRLERGAGATPRGPEGKTREPTIFYHGGQSYAVDGREAKRVTDREHNVLQTFLRRSPLEKSELDSSGYDPDTVLTILRSLKGTKRRPAKYDAMFADCITFPGARSRGGYRVRIRKA